jgi:hypothetical protein
MKLDSIWAYFNFMGFWNVTLCIIVLEQAVRSFQMLVPVQQTTVYIPSRKPSVKQLDLGKLYYRLFSVKLLKHILCWHISFYHCCKQLPVSLLSVPE